MNNPLYVFVLGLIFGYIIGFVSHAPAFAQVIPL